MHQQTNQAQTGVQAPATPRAPQVNENVSPMSREDVQKFRDQVRQSIRAQINGGAQDGANGAPAGIPTGPHNIVIRGPDGKETVASVPSYDARHLIPQQAVDISVAFFMMVAAIIIGLPIARAFARGIDKRASRSTATPEIATQLTQLNQAVDAIALEVERISEGQRYTTKLLSDQRDPARQSLGTSADR
jgi:hypothetical protein